MKISKKFQSKLIAAYLSGMTAFATSLNTNAASDLDAVTKSVNSSITDIVDVITPIAWAVVILVLVIMGCVLLWGGDKAKEKVQSHITAIVIGCVLIAGATTIANWWTSSLTSNFGS